MKNKYILVSWPDVQTYMGHPRWNECIFCKEIPGHSCPDCSYMIPEDLYNEINEEDEIIYSNLGKIVISDDYATIEGVKYFYDTDNMSRGDIVVIYDPYNNIYELTKCVACTTGMPIILEDSSKILGINCQFVGYRKV